MASTITAGNSSNGGLVATADTTGALEIKTGSGTGTTAISISAIGAVTIPNLIGGGGNYVYSAYTTPFIWVKPVGLKAIKVTVVGGGGGGGSATLPNNPIVIATAGGGGGGGGASILVIDAPNIPGPISITAGPGTNSFGGFCSATAGSAGGNSLFTSNTQVTLGGAGGLGSSGTVNIQGDGGGMGVTASGQSSAGGNGGTSILGGGGLSSTAGNNYGGGGGGGVRSGAGNPGTTPGTTGAPGIVIVEEFY
jgi:hypothetical protein